MDQIDSAHQNRNGKEGRSGGQAADYAERSRGHFSQNDVVAAKMGEKQQTERAIATFTAEGIHRHERAAEKRVSETESAENAKKLAPHHSGAGPTAEGQVRKSEDRQGA